MLKRTHAKLLARSRRYANWHSHPHHEFVHFLLLATALMGTAGYMVPLSSAGPAAANLSQTVPMNERAVSQLMQLTERLLNANNDHRKAPANEKGAAYSGLEQALKNRREMQLALMKTDPDQIIKSAMPEELRKTFPATLQNLLEQSVVIEGTLESFIMEDPKARYEEYFHILKDSQGNSVRLRTNSQLVSAQNGDKVRIRGVRVANDVALSALEIR
jgi:hypothetical protein